MKIDGGLVINDLATVPERVRTLEAAGYDAVVSAELANDPFLPLALAAEHSERVKLQTSIAVAFARNPMTLAQTAHDLNAFSKGRMMLGLGSQIRPHITKRFSMPWDKPASRMRELILAMRAIWDCWYEGKQLDFRGDFYTHTLMTPMFTPRELRYGAPPVFLAAVGPRMTEVAGEVADGLIAHGFTTDAYLREVTLPRIKAGLAKSGRTLDDFEVIGEVHCGFREWGLGPPCLHEKWTFVSQYRYTYTRVFRTSPRYHQKLDFIVQNLLGNIANAFPSLLHSLWWPRSRLPSRNRYSVYYTGFGSEPVQKLSGWRAL